MAIETMGVVGAGTMGAGIAQVAAQAGYNVTLVDVSETQLERGSATIEGNLSRLLQKGRISAGDRDAAMGRITTSSDPAVLSGVHLVVEAITEKFEAKASLMSQLDSICAPGTILASNTSSISITRLAAVTRRPDRFVGMHFFNPVPVMKLVEVVRGLGTSDETTALVVELAKSLGKTPVDVRDFPGFISNRLLMPMLNEAAYALMEGVASPEAIDAVMKLGMNHPMGPLELADLIGLDVCLDIMRVLHEGMGDDKYRPCPLLVKLVAAGRLGRKSGQGFFDYPVE